MKNKSKNISKEDKKLKRILAVLIGCFVIGLGAAAHFLGYSGSVIATIDGGGDEVLNIIYDFNDLSLDTSSSSATNISELKIYNPDGVKNFTASLDILKVPENINCTDWENDCSIILSNSEGIINDGSNFTIYSGDNYFNLTLSCIKYSCEQNASIDITFEPI